MHIVVMSNRIRLLLPIRTFDREHNHTNIVIALGVGSAE